MKRLPPWVFSKFENSSVTENQGVGGKIHFIHVETYIYNHTSSDYENLLSSTTCAFVPYGRSVSLSSIYLFFDL